MAPGSYYLRGCCDWAQTGWPVNLVLRWILHELSGLYLFTLVSDMFPKRAVGSVVGIGGMAGSVGGMLIALVVGAILQKTGSYVPIFVMAASAYLVALVIIQLLVPQLAPADLDTDPTT